MANTRGHERSKRRKYHAAVAKQEVEASVEVDKVNSRDYTNNKEIEAELKRLLLEEDNYRCEGSLYHFIKAAWAYIGTGEFKDAWYIQAVAEHVQACIEQELPGNDLVVCIPPRHLKSGICSVAAPAWTWGPRNLPSTKFLNYAYAQPLATRDALKSRRMIQTKWYQDAWGDRFKLSGDQNAKTRYDNDCMGHRIASSVTGLSTGEGYDVLIVDDPLNAAKRASAAELSKVIEWWSGAMPSRRDDPLTSRRIVIMQRIHENDLIGHIESTDIESWTVLKIPMEYSQRYWHSPLGWEDPRTKDGELLSPERIPRQQVEKIKKDLREYNYSAQYQQEPVPPDGGIIKDKWFRYWSVTQDYEMVWQSWDLAMNDDARNDYTVGTVWGKIGCDRYLLDMFRGQWDINEQAKRIVMANRRFPQTRTTLIENKANGHAVVKLLKDPVQIRKIHHYAVPGLALVDPKNLGGDKANRLLMCSTEFSAGSVYFPPKDRMPWIEDVKKELCGFPKYKNDDIVDSISQSLNWVAQFGGSLLDFQYPTSFKEIYEQRQREKELQVEPTFGGRVTQRGLKDIFL